LESWTAGAWALAFDKTIQETRNNPMKANPLINAIASMIIGATLSNADLITVTAIGKVSSFPEVLANEVGIGDIFTVQFSIETDLLPETLDGFFVKDAITKLRIIGPSGINFTKEGSLSVSELGFGNFGGPNQINFNVAPGFNQFQVNSQASLRQVFLSAQDALFIDTNNIRGTLETALRDANFASGPGVGGFSIGVNFTSGLNTSGIALETQEVSITTNVQQDVPQPEVAIFRAHILRFNALQGIIYKLQTSSDLIEWTDTGRTLVGHGSMAEFSIEALLPKEFYKVIPVQ
jgi:hypothetical protein